MDIPLNHNPVKMLVHQISAQEILSQKINLSIQNSEINSEINQNDNIADIYSINDLNNMSVNFNQLRSENHNLNLALTKSVENCQLLTEKTQKLEKINHNLSQDLKLRDIHFMNLKMINIKLTNTIKNLQNYREYVMQLILKRNRASLKIKKLIIAVKNMQNILKHKNTVIKRINNDNHRLVQQAGNFIKSNYII
jgi:hypothetical protein